MQVYFTAFVLMAVAAGMIGRNIDCSGSSCFSRCFFHFEPMAPGSSQNSTVSVDQMPMSVSHPYGLLIAGNVWAYASCFVMLGWMTKDDGVYTTYVEFSKMFWAAALQVFWSSLLVFCAAILLTQSAVKFSAASIPAPECAHSLVALSWIAFLMMTLTLAWQIRGVVAMKSLKAPHTARIMAQLKVILENFAHRTDRCIFLCWLRLHICLIWERGGSMHPHVVWVGVRVYVYVRVVCACRVGRGPI